MHQSIYSAVKSSSRAYLGCFFFYPWGLQFDLKRAARVEDLITNELSCIHYKNSCPLSKLRWEKPLLLRNQILSP